MPELQVYYGLRTIVYEETPEGHWRYKGWIQQNGEVREGYHRTLDGRPVMSVGSIKHYVYRLTFLAIRGHKVPGGLVPDHTCLAKWCIFPDHLEPVKQVENMKRAGLTGGDQHVGQALKTHCPQGHEYTPENTYTWRNERQCKTCRLETKRAYNLRLKLARRVIDYAANT